MTALRIDRTLAAPPPRVWRAFTTPELADWLWPPSWKTTCEIDLRPEGRYRLSSVESGMTLSGEFVLIEPTTRLVQTWRWDGEEEETLVTITLAESEAGGTHLRVVHERFATDESRALHHQGWNDCLDRLPGAVDHPEERAQ